MAPHPSQQAEPQTQKTFVQQTNSDNINNNNSNNNNNNNNNDDSNLDSEYDTINGRHILPVSTKNSNLNNSGTLSSDHQYSDQSNQYQQLASTIEQTKSLNFSERNSRNNIIDNHHISRNNDIVQVHDHNSTKFDNSTRNNATINNATINNTPTNKANGLRNRILQRPPPLILDRVSNFYDDQSNHDTINIHTRHKSNDATASKTITADSSCSSVKTSTANTDGTTTNTSFSNGNDNNNSTNCTTFASRSNINQKHQTSNQKFWASLNQNKYKGSSRSDVANNEFDGQSQAKFTHHAPSKDTIESSSSFGADLIINHRNVSVTHPKFQTNFDSKIESESNPPTSSGNYVTSSTSDSSIGSNNNSSNQNTKHISNSRLEHDQINYDGTKQQYRQLKIDPLYGNKTNETETDYQRNRDVSNTSEPDESSAIAIMASENGGGNLIGVNNSTPPVQYISGELSNQEEHHQKERVRSRENNPFLNMNDEHIITNIETQGGNFHRRPASFIAATGSALINQQNQTLVQNDINVTSQQLALHEQLEGMGITNENHHRITMDDPTYHQNASNQLNGNQNSPFSHTDNNRPNLDSYASHGDPKSKKSLISQTDEADNCKHAEYPLTTAYQSSNQCKQASHHTARNPDHSFHQYYDIHQQPQQSIYGIYSHSNNHNISDCEPTISLDSESAVCKPPPSATMQLPHWTEAIYELNNAILETSSVAGGAENGKFIYIVESGDIILELDQIKVSGFTLVEFNDLLESSTTHLLSAVQTKHSHSLTTDLKDYLNRSYPKDSADKELQDLIRENIYRRTIPCTTRPPKIGEMDKIDYHFLTNEQFIELDKRGQLLECGAYAGHYYGTLRPFSDLSHLDSSKINRINNNNNSITSHSSNQGVKINENSLGSTSLPKQDVGLPLKPAASLPTVENHPLYENHDSLKLHHKNELAQNSHVINPPDLFNDTKAALANGSIPTPSIQYGRVPIIPVNEVIARDTKESNIFTMDDDLPLPFGWERVMDQTHGVYYIDHNIKRTQYERPYEVELTRGYMGFGFTLVEADNGLLLVRSIIPWGPAQMNGLIRPGDILLSAVGISVAGLQHADLARLFSTFLVGDTIRLTFARGSHPPDGNLNLSFTGHPTSNSIMVKQHQMHQQQQLQQQPQQTQHQYNSQFTANNSLYGQFAPDYQHMPLYSNSIMLNAESNVISATSKPNAISYVPENNFNSANYHNNNFYANNEEIALQRVQYDQQQQQIQQQQQQQQLHLQPQTNQQCHQQLSTISSDYLSPNKLIIPDNYQQPQPQPPQQMPHQNANSIYENSEEFEYHQIELTRADASSNWGIRLIGGAEVERAISIGSIVSGGAAAANGKLEPGDEIISIDGVCVVGSTHQHVVDLISACLNRTILLVRRKKAEACDVVLTRNMDEGFGFYIISKGNGPLIGQIIEGSLADRCQQLNENDRIITVNGRQIAPNTPHAEIVNMIKESGSTLRLRIIPANYYSVELIKSSPNDSFGFRMRGGVEYGTPLFILKVTPGGLARDLLNVGDQIVEINGIPTVGMTHHQAAAIIKFSDPIVKLKLRRSRTTPPSLLVDSPRALQNFNQVIAEVKTVHKSKEKQQMAPGLEINGSVYENQEDNQSISIAGATTGTIAE